MNPAEWIEAGRVKTGHFGTSRSDGCDGAFVIDGMKIIASSGDGWEDSGMPLPAWEHVSVSFRDRCPSWEEMTKVKEGFWLPKETVYQIHPAATEYVNFHPFCLHLWRRIGSPLPLPPSVTVGPNI